MRRNNAILVKQLNSLIGKYNSLAAERGMQKMPYPPYGNALNDMSRRFLLRDLKAISNAITEIEEIPVKNDETDELKTARGVRFASKTIPGLSVSEAWTVNDDDLWYYIKNDDGDICVYANMANIIKRLNGGTELVLKYEDMPYEVLVDGSGKEWKVNRYTVDAVYDELPTVFGLFGYRFGQVEWNSVISTLTSLTLQNWSIRNVEDVSFMFSGCSKLIAISLGKNFDTSAVTNMNNMFSGCSSLTTLDISNFNTSLVEDMAYMFSGCSSLTTLDLSSFNTSKVTDMRYMFAYCKGLTALTLGENFNTSNVTVMTEIFSNCNSLNTLTLCQNASSIIKELPSDIWEVKNNTLMNVGRVTISQGSSAEWSEEPPDTWTEVPWNFYRLRTARGVKFEAGLISGLPDDVKAWTKDEYDLWYYIMDENETDIYVYAKTSEMAKKITEGKLTLDYVDMPYELLEGDGSEWTVNGYTAKIKVNGLTRTYGLFCERNMDNDWTTNVLDKLTSSLTLRNWTNRNVTDMSWMFTACDLLLSITLIDFNTSKVTNMEYMFAGDRELTDLILGENFDTSKVTNMSEMFYNCDDLAVVSLYQNASFIVKKLWGTWTVTDNTSTNIGTVVIQSSSATWNLTVSDPWANSPLTLSR